MSALANIRLEIERKSERRADLWHKLAQGHDPEIAAELKRLDDELDALWDQQRQERARLVFGERDRIIVRARLEERLERAA
jgi:hypothetical protein